MEQNHLFSHTKTIMCKYIIPTGAIATNAIFLYGVGVGPIFLDELQCTGTEERLLDCTSDGLGVHDCSHFEDVAVTCNRTQPVTPCKYTISRVYLRGASPHPPPPPPKKALKFGTRLYIYLLLSEILN